MQEVQRDPLTARIIGAAIEVNKALGPGLLESSYASCLRWELTQMGLAVACEVPLPVVYKQIRLDCGYRLDMLVGDSVLLEIKAVEKLSRLHEAQLLTYLRLSGKRTGLLINFNVTKLTDGLRRFVL